MKMKAQPTRNRKIVLQQKITNEWHNSTSQSPKGDRKKKKKTEVKLQFKLKAVDSKKLEMLGKKLIKRVTKLTIHWVCSMEKGCFLVVVNSVYDLFSCFTASVRCFVFISEEQLLKSHNSRFIGEDFLVFSVSGNVLNASVETLA